MPRKKPDPVYNPPVVDTTLSYTTVYTDGSSTGGVGDGGWAWAVHEGPEASGSARETTNQRMEITAAYEAVRTLSGLLLVVSDSQYVVNCFNQNWYRGWHRKGWKNAQGNPVMNRDLWEPFIDLYLSRGGEVRFHWVKGHSNDLMNDRVDALAKEARLSLRPTLQAPAA